MEGQIEAIAAILHQSIRATQDDLVKEGLWGWRSAGRRIRSARSVAGFLRKTAEERRCHDQYHDGERQRGHDGCGLKRL